jgi:hypothetical protein
MFYAVQTLTKMRVPFAIKGGGHMPIPGYASINSSGVMLSSSGLNQLQISEDRTTVDVGLGNGVPGYMIGGGVSFFGNEYGWASANMVSLTVSVFLIFWKREVQLLIAICGQTVCSCQWRCRGRHSDQ